MNNKKGNAFVGFCLFGALIASFVQVGIQIYLCGHETATEKIYAEATKLGYAKKIETSKGETYSWILPASATAELK